MNVSNIGPQDSGVYAKSESPPVVEIKRPMPEIKQLAPEIKTELSFDEKMEQANRREKTDDIIDIINTSNKSLKTFDRKLEMSVHSKTKEIMVKVIDTNTDEVIREIPPEKVLDGVAYRREIAGMLMDKKI